MRYFHKHLLIACGISVVFLNPLAGAGFYTGRELRDWQRSNWFDKQGFLWPVLPLLLLAIPFYSITELSAATAVLCFVGSAAAGVFVRDRQKELFWSFFDVAAGLIALFAAYFYILEMLP